MALIDQYLNEIISGIIGLISGSLLTISIQKSKIIKKSKMVKTGAASINQNNAQAGRDIIARNNTKES